MHEHIQVIPDKCRACRRCEVACIAAHHGMTFKEAMKHRDVLVSRVQVVKAEGFKTTVRCHQCNPAPCCKVCPTGALQQEEDGRIVMRVQFCVACKMCIAVCPYGTISLDSIGMPDMSGDHPETMAMRARREVAVRCDMCAAWREKNGKKITACMEACPVQALSMVEADGTVIEAPAPEKKVAPVKARPASVSAAHAPAPAPGLKPDTAEPAPAPAAAAEKPAPKAESPAARAESTEAATAPASSETPAETSMETPQETPGPQATEAVSAPEKDAAPQTQHAPQQDAAPQEAPAPAQNTAAEQETAAEQGTTREQKAAAEQNTAATAAPQPAAAAKSAAEKKPAPASKARGKAAATRRDKA